jgi:hypothetical protein
MAVQFAAFATLLLDQAHLRDDFDDPGDHEIWLPLLDREGRQAGRILVRVGIFAGDGA